MLTAIALLEFLMMNFSLDIVSLFLMKYYLFFYVSRFRVSVPSAESKKTMICPGSMERYKKEKKRSGQLSDPLGQSI